MGMVYEDEPESALIDDYLQVEDFEDPSNWRGYLKVTEGVDDLYEAGLGRWGRHPIHGYPAFNIRRKVTPTHRTRFGIPPGQRRKIYRRVTERGGRFTRKITPPWMQTDHPASVRQIRRARRPRWGRGAGPRRMRRRVGWARKVQRKAAKQSWWDRRFRHLSPAQRAALQAQYVARSKKILSRYGLMSDYLQVEGDDLDPNLGQLDIFKKIATSLGLRDPIAHYEPGASLSEVYAKYVSWEKDMRNRIGLLGSVKQREPLLTKLNKIAALLAELRPAFSGGGTPGERDRDKLATVVQDSRFLKRELRDAEQTYGTRAAAPLPAEPPAPAGTPVPPEVTPQRGEEVDEGTPLTTYLLIGGGGLLALKLLKVF